MVTHVDEETISRINHDLSTRVALELREVDYFRTMFGYIRNNRPYNLIQRLSTDIYDVNHKYSHNGMTLLHYAVLCKNYHIVKLLIIDFHCNLFVKSNGKTAFYMACENGFISIIRNLFMTQNFYPLHICDMGGYSPLLVAYHNKHYPVCNLLIEKGANIHKVAYDGFQISDFDKIYRFHRESIDSTPIRTHVPRTPIRILFRTQERTRNTEERKEESKETKDMPSFFIREHMEMLVQTKKSCPICMEEYKENNVKIFEKCFHNSCCECYSKIDKCHYCRIDIK
jgi:ankyrin repeat protein